MIYKRVLEVLNEPVAGGAANVRVPVEAVEFVLRAVDAAGVPVAFTVVRADATDKPFHFAAGESMKEEELVLFDDLVLRVGATDAVAPTVSADQLTIADGVATDAVGVKLVFASPAGGSARVHGASIFNNAGAPTVQLEVVRGGVVTVIDSRNASAALALGIVLEVDDSIRWNVTAAAAPASTADFTISATETAPGPVPAPAAIVEVRVWGQ